MNLKEFAKSLGLSQTTVSRALNGYPEVNEATRQRVVAMADQMNYRPNARARSLAIGRAQTVGHVIPLSSQSEITNPIFADFLAGAGEVYARAGYDIQLSVVSDEEEPNVYRKLSQTRAVDGIIVHSPKKNDPRIALLSELGLPFVVHGRSSGVEQAYSWVDVNNRRGFQRATEFLTDLGHRCIALINGHEALDFAIRRRDGYERGLRNAGLAPEPALMHSDEMTEFNGYTAANQLLEAEQPPTAFVVASLISAIGVRRAIEGKGLEMGKDISVIIHDDDLSYFRDGGSDPVFTALRSSVKEAGQKSAAMLLSLIQDPHQQPLQDLLEVDFLLGRSTGPCPA